MLELTLIRHGRTEGNAAGRYPAMGEDPPLSAEGQAQARTLTGMTADLVLSSPAARAMDTARMAGFSDPRTVPALREAEFGVMAGHTWAQLEAEHGAAPRAWIDALADPEADAGPPGGDTGRRFHGRVETWLDGLPDGRVVAFTHAGVILATLRLCVGLRAATVLPARLTTLRRAGGAWWLTGLNLPRVDPT